MEDKRITAIPAEVEEKVRALRQEAEQANDLRKAYTERLRAYESAEQKARAAEGPLKAARAECEAARNAISRAQSQLDSLRGLFTGKRRRALEAEIAEAQSRLRAAEAGLPGLEAQLEKARAEMPEKPEMPELPDEREAVYQCAGVYAQARLYDLAAREYCKIRGYRDVEDILESDRNLSDELYKPGNSICFGRYRQSGDASQDPTPIEWLVLANDGRTVTLISRLALDSRPYFEAKVGAGVPVTWATSSLNPWLNGEFLNAAFTAKEQAQLEAVTVTADPNRRYMTDSGFNTQGRVFLPSIDDALKFFESNEARACFPTAYAVARGARTGGNGTCYWWLRTPGEGTPGGGSNRAACVFSDGSIYEPGDLVYRKEDAVRPMIVLRLK